jgi:hypothetical protein
MSIKKNELGELIYPDTDDGYQAFSKSRLHHEELVVMKREKKAHKVNRFGNTEVSYEDSLMKIDKEIQNEISTIYCEKIRVYIEKNEIMWLKEDRLNRDNFFLENEKKVILSYFDLLKFDAGEIMNVIDHKVIKYIHKLSQLKSKSFKTSTSLYGTDSIIPIFFIPTALDRHLIYSYTVNYEYTRNEDGQ